ncbi:JAB domain-containing protein [Pseudoxanthomonas sp. USHLN014]|uniref:JAB domain-containing protein n=1 Tax=Pseudoxanthomonas sp. USHLN014 TaxID=3081297 RepID=UPI00301D8DE5
MSLSASDASRRLREDTVIYRAMKIIHRRCTQPGEQFDPDASRQFFGLRLHAEQREHFEVAFLNAKNQLISVERMFHGTVDGCHVETRDVVRHALLHNACAVVVAHNHPSGDPTPSHADYAVTHRLEDALAQFDIRLLEHIVVGGDRTVAFGPVHDDSNPRNAGIRARYRDPAALKRLEAARKGAETRKRNRESANSTVRA